MIADTQQLPPSDLLAFLPPKLWFTTGEVAELLGYEDAKTVREMIYAGEIRPVKRRRPYRIARVELERLARLVAE